MEAEKDHQLHQPMWTISFSSNFKMLLSTSRIKERIIVRPFIIC